MRKSTFLKESESVDSEPHYFHLGGDFVIQEREIKRWKKAVTGFYSSLRDFCTVTLSLIFTVKGIGSGSNHFYMLYSKSLQINFFL